MKVKIDFIFLGIVGIGITCQLTAMWFTGVIRNGEAFYCCGDQNDNLWFAAVTNQLIERIPPFQPGMYGILFRNYHYWSNLIVAETSRLFFIPSFQMQFQYFTVLLSFLLASLISGFSMILRLSVVFKRWLAIFFFFGSDLIYLVLFLLGRKIDFSMSSLEDGVGFLTNLPRSFSVIVLLGSLILFIYWLRKKDWILTVILALLFGSLVGFKIYIGIFAFVGLGSVALYHFIRRKSFRPSGLLLLSGICAACVFLPMNSESGGLFFSGLWRFENFAVQPALGLIRLELARQIFLNDSKWHRVALYEIFFAVIYIVSTFGTKLIGLIQSKESLKKFPPELHIFLISGSVVSLVLGFFFLQNVGSSNTFNFLVSVFIFLSFYAALTCDTMLGKVAKMMRYGLIVLIIASMLPRIVYRTKTNITELVNVSGFKLTADVVNAGNFLQEKTLPDSLIAVDNRPFRFDVNGPVFQAISKRHMFYSGEGLLNALGAQEDEKIERRKITKEIFQNGSSIEVAKLLMVNRIDYLILSPFIPLVSTSSAVFLEPVYEKETVLIYQVHQDKIPKSVVDDAREASSATNARYQEILRKYLR